MRILFVVVILSIACAIMSSAETPEPMTELEPVIAKVACYPKSEPAGMRVPEARVAKEILDAKEATHARADRPQAA